jgi:hypothetical protein
MGNLRVQDQALAQVQVIDSATDLARTELERAQGTVQGDRNYRVPARIEKLKTVIAENEQQKEALLERWSKNLSPADARSAASQVAINQGDQFSKSAIAHILRTQPDIPIEAFQAAISKLPLSNDLRARLSQATAGRIMGRDIQINPSSVQYLGSASGKRR